MKIEITIYEIIHEDEDSVAAGTEMEYTVEDDGGGFDEESFDSEEFEDGAEVAAKDSADERKEHYEEEGHEVSIVRK